MKSAHFDKLMSLTFNGKHCTRDASAAVSSCVSFTLHSAHEPILTNNMVRYVVRLFHIV